MIRILLLCIALTLAPSCGPRKPNTTAVPQSPDRKLAVANDAFASALNGIAEAIVTANHNNHLPDDKTREILMYLDKLVSLSTRIAMWQVEGNSIASLRQELLDVTRYIMPRNYISRRFPSGDMPQGVSLAATALDMAMNNLKGALK